MFDLLITDRIFVATRHLATVLLLKDYHVLLLLLQHTPYNLRREGVLLGCRLFFFHSDYIIQLSAALGDSLHDEVDKVLEAEVARLREHHVFVKGGS